MVNVVWENISMLNIQRNECQDFYLIDYELLSSFDVLSIISLQRVFS